MRLSREPVMPDAGGRSVDVLKLRVGRASFPNYVYLVFDPVSRDAVVVDPGWETGLILDLVKQHRLALRAVLLTHSHRDHTNRATAVAKAAECPILGSRLTLASLADSECHRQVLSDDTVLEFGGLTVTCLMTPGHTACSISFVIGDCLFPGDTVFLEGCGLVTAPQGNSEALFRSVSRLIELVPDNTRVFPGHKYQQEPGAAFSTVKKQNFHLRLTGEEAFVAFCQRPRNGQKPPAIGTVPDMIPEVDGTPIYDTHSLAFQAEASAIQKGFNHAKDNVS